MIGNSATESMGNAELDIATAWHGAHNLNSKPNKDFAGAFCG